MKIILLGPPGSGKGTVSARLAKNFHLAPVSAGELLREEVKAGTTIGKEIKKYLEKGDLVPDKFVVEMIKLEVKGKKNYILDGFPRSIEQAKEIMNLDIDLVLYLKVSGKAVVERISGRRVCEKGEHNYHLKYIPPKKEGICDIDGTKLLQRKDDAPQVVKDRFKIYHKDTQPLIKYYQQQGILRTIDGSSSPDKVYGAVKKEVEKI